MRYRLKWILRTIYLFLIFFRSHFVNASPILITGDSIRLSIGIWRGEIIRTDGQPITFNFQTRETFGKIIIYIMNGSERLMVDNIQQQGDSVFIEMPFFDSRFALRILDEQTLEGNWIKNYGDHQAVVPFKATFNQNERFPVHQKPAFNISGRWAVHFKGVNDSTESIGEFKQSGAQVRGTFLTPTGDYRFLEGVVDGDTMRLSTFDGGHAYSFVSKIRDSTTMEGFYYAGAIHVETWVAEKNADATLPDEFGLVRIKDTANASLHFKFPDLDKKMVSISDSVFKNKVVILQILGSWCPNCMDETRFMSAWYIQHKSRGVEVVGLAYERTASFTDAKRLLQPFILRFHVTYPILVTGIKVDDSLRTEKTLPEIDKIQGFPTTIFIDKKGFIRKIHTGFNGPGTGEHYEMYKKEFNELVDSLLKE